MKTLTCALAAVMLFSVAVPGAGSASTTEQIDRLLSDAVEVGDTASTRDELQRALANFQEALRLSETAAYPNGVCRALWGQGTFLTLGCRLDDALKSYDKALDVGKKSGCLECEAATLHGMGYILYMRGAYGESADLYEKSLLILRKTGNAKEEGQVLQDLGELLEFDLGQYEKARGYLETAVNIARKESDRRREASGLVHLGRLHRELQEYPEAMACYEKGLAIAREVRYTQFEIWALFALAVVHRDLGRYDQGIACAEKAVELGRKLGYVWGEDVSLHDLGLVYAARGDLEKAAECFEKSYLMGKLRPDERDESVSLSALADVRLAQGHYVEAMKYYEKRLAVVRRHGEAPWEGIALANIGRTCAAQGQTQKATAYFEMARAANRQHGTLGLETCILRGLGKICAERGRYEEAFGYYKKALEIEKRRGLATYAQTNRLIGHLLLDQGEGDKAEPYAKEADSPEIMGRLFLVRGEYGMARDQYERGLTKALVNQEADELFAAYTGLGVTSEKLGEYKKAEEYYEKGIKLTEELRSAVSPAERKDFFEVRISGFSRVEPAKGLTRVRMKLNEGVRSIESSELTRARAFSDGIALRSEAGVSGVPGEVLQKEEELVTRLAALKKDRSKVTKEQNTERYENITKEIVKVELELDTFVEMLWARYRPYAAVKYPRPVVLKDSAIRPDEHLIIFDVLGDGVGVNLVKGKELVESQYVTWKQEDLEKDVQRFLSPFAHLKLKEFDPNLGKELYTKLLSAALSKVPRGEPVTIIPDGVLSLLPFEALVMDGRPEWTESGGRPILKGLTYVGDIYPISYHQSITALTLARTIGTKAKAADKALVMADPVFGPDDPRLTSLAKAKQQKTTEPITLTLMSIREELDLTFPRLWRTSELGEALKGLDPNHTDLYLGLQASKSVLFEKSLDAYRWIVFATHGYFRANLPTIQEPVLVLTLVNQPEGKDGFLRMTEVMGLKLNADIVALTACQTGLGQRVTGEGTLNMGRAFQYAGSRSVLMSLWSVAETSSVKLVESFFKHLKEGKTKLDALKLAREEIRKDGYDHPFYWAPFILVGEVN